MVNDSTATVPRTKFEQWMRDFGVQRLVNEMNKRGGRCEVTWSAAYYWLRGTHEPRAHKQRALIELSRGQLTLEDIDAHFRQKQAEHAAAHPEDSGTD